MKVGDLVRLTIMPRIGLITAIVSQKEWVADQVFIYFPNEDTRWSCAKYYVKVIQ